MYFLQNIIFYDSVFQNLLKINNISKDKNG